VTDSPFRIPISDLAEAGSRRDVVLDADVDWGFELADVGPVHAELVLENAAGVLVVRGTVESELGLTCHRCLTEWEQDLELGLAEAMGFEDDEDADVYRLDGDVADLEPVLRDAVLLEVPLRPLCRPDCLGLCATCGADLNDGPHPAHAEESTSPFAGLRDLLEP
jgi:uncharacterized protein